MSSDNQDQPDGVDVQPGGLRPPSAERIADVTLGAGVVAIEKLEQVAGDLDNRIRHALADAPQFVDSLEEKGRPIRDRILNLIRQRPTVADVFSAAARTEDPSDDKMQIAQALFHRHRIQLRPYCNCTVRFRKRMQISGQVLRRR